MALVTAWPDTYKEWSEKRLAVIVDHYTREFFGGVSVIDCGCGHGYVGDGLEKIGATVFYADGRQEHIVHRERGMVVDFNATHDLRLARRFDMILALGILYHLSRPVEFLRWACEHSDNVVVDSLVLDCDDPQALLFLTEHVDYDQSLDRIGCRPSPQWIERELSLNGMTSTRVVDPGLDAGHHKYTWQASNSWTWAHDRRAFWFARRET